MSLLGCNPIPGHFYCFTRQHLQIEACTAAPLQALPHPASLPSQGLSSLCQATPLQWMPTAAWLAQPKWCQAMMSC